MMLQLTVAGLLIYLWSNNYVQANQHYTFRASDLAIKQGPAFCGKDVYLPHMFKVFWSQETGWGQPVIVPVEEFEFHPATRMIQKGMTVFDALESKVDLDGNVRTFKLVDYTTNLVKMSKRAGLPEFDPVEHQKSLLKLFEVDKPTYRLKCNYPFNTIRMRSVITAMDKDIEIAPSRRAVLYSYNYYHYANQPRQPSKFYFDPRYLRGFPGSMTYDIKVAANYMAPMMMMRFAREKGYDDVTFLWNGLITEASTSTIFVVFAAGSNGCTKPELATPTIKYVFNGKTRQTILELAKNWTDIVSVERDIPWEELVTAANENRILSMFQASTSIHAQPISCVHNAYTNQTINIPVHNDFLVQRINRFYEWLFFENRQPHKWIHVV